MCEILKRASERSVKRRPKRKI